MGKVHTVAAQQTVLATGGAGKAYLYTTNPDTATGDGIAMGWRAGCRVANMEFIQFHPTCLYHAHAKPFLISETVRGEGGVLMTDLAGRTDISGLYAVCETACTGLHGANRLASNSLLECLVFGMAAAQDILAQPAPPPSSLRQWDESRVSDADEEIVIAHNWDELRRFMWDYVGIVRTSKGLERALHRIRLLQDEIHDYYANFRVTNDLLELRNLVTSAELIVRSALLRHESRGLHFSRDYPDTLAEARNTVLRRVSDHAD